MGRTKGRFNSCPREGGVDMSPFTFSMTKVSIHAPVKGASRLHQRRWQGGIRFNSCPREGGVALAAEACCINLLVSIHAPVKGASSSKGDPRRRYT